MVREAGPSDSVSRLELYDELHDESTFKSGGVSAKRWFFGEEAPFHSKGRGRSNMVSDFLVQHPSGPFFSLSQSEYQEALVKYPHLETDSGISYVERSATASIHLGQDSYFDNMTILLQSERLFQLLQFKKQYKGHTIECVVDNARSHTAKSHSLFEFGKSIGTRCPVEKNRIHGCKELKANLPSKIKLDDLRELLSDHPAFKTVSRLEKLAEKYGVTIKFCPKFLCELNCIEGLWCSQKLFIRRKTDQTYNKLLQ